MTGRKKLIEVALPLEAINRESAREKSIRHGHPSTLHLWWARRPLAACRAVLFASLVDDPSSRPEEFPTEEAQNAERERLFGIIEELVKWENSNNEHVLELAREEIRKATGGNPPPVLDPFCGGGSIPLEAQRLGLEAYASDLNPVAVLITKALIEIPPRFAGQPPINPEARRKLGYKGSWRGAQGLAEDVRYYGRWMRDRAWERIGHLYPKVKLPREHGGGEATVIAWLWARTVRCPNPACGAQMPLVRSFWLSTKEKKKAWVEPIVDRKAKTVRFEVRSGHGEAPEGTVDRRGARCIVCGAAVTFDHVRSEGRAGRMGAQLMAIVAEGGSGRVYAPPDPQHEQIAAGAVPADDLPDTDLPERALGFRVQAYGMTKHRDLFTARQLVALTTFSDLVAEAREQALADAIAAGLPDDGRRLTDGGTGAPAYADAIATYLAFAVDRCADRWSSFATWRTQSGGLRHTFARQALAMVWDFAEANPFSGSAGNWSDAVERVAWNVGWLEATERGYARQLDAAEAVDGIAQPLIATDPPYYDNISYSDLSDFFYVWLRRSIGSVYPNLFSTLLTPKEQELVATPYRFDGDRRRAERFFEDGFRRMFRRARERHHPEYPMVLFYAYKKMSSVDGARVSTGWAAFLEGLLDSGFAVTAAWPLRTERAARLRALAGDALDCSVVLVCRPRPEDAPTTTRKHFAAALRAELRNALRRFAQGGMRRSDLVQAAMGLGMVVFSRYAKVVEAGGGEMLALAFTGLINEICDEFVAVEA